MSILSRNKRNPLVLFSPLKIVLQNKNNRNPFCFHLLISFFKTNTVASTELQSRYEVHAKCKEWHRTICYPSQSAGSNGITFWWFCSCVSRGCPPTWASANVSSCFCFSFNYPREPAIGIFIVPFCFLVSVTISLNLISANLLSRDLTWRQIELNYFHFIV